MVNVAFLLICLPLLHQTLSLLLSLLIIKVWQFSALIRDENFGVLRIYSSQKAMKEPLSFRGSFVCSCISFIFCG